ncbi:hypothetical protein DJ021_12560 [Phenylobacterium hankyongense]|uniref:Secreted protein n=1 Tax=Phenylobacterium hankyongense TaxID=1813876 RepID=A0A328B195_9CAUL|nr:hypothetical protein [Phenylobacterium hankyongense]RAK60577.1 hypothetical protein DJ021_12560 [Phenylobacterium hankyongense]
MKFAAIALTAASLLTTAAAAAADRTTDLDYLKANRCRGLAAGIGGSVDTSGLDSFIKTEGRGRNPYVVQRAQEEFDKAKRQARSAEARERLSAELAGPCVAYMGSGGAGKDMAVR